MTKTIAQSEFIPVHSTVLLLLIFSLFATSTSTRGRDDNRKYLFTIPTRPQMQFHFVSTTNLGTMTTDKEVYSPRFLSLSLARKLTQMNLYSFR
jgi:hypothetical protein